MDVDPNEVAFWIMTTITTLILSACLWRIGSQVRGWRKAEEGRAGP